MAIHNIFGSADSRDNNCDRDYKSQSETIIEDKCKYCKYNKSGEQRNLVQDNYKYDMQKHYESRQLTQEENDIIEELIKEYTI